MARLIDADALTEWMIRELRAMPNGAFNMLNGRQAANLIGRAIDEAPTVGSWISVKDRLPKSIINKVLVWLEHDDLVGYIGFGHYEKYKGQEIWFDLEHSEAFSVRGYTVTHWMPLPEPPEEVNENAAEG